MSAPVKGGAAAKSAELREQIFGENDRLNRLIRNLYLYLNLDYYNVGEFFDNVCQVVSDYFVADSCALFLSRSRRDADPPAFSGAANVLELVGASGAWRRALRQRFVREAVRTEYPLGDRGGSLPVTVQAFGARSPFARLSGHDIRGGRGTAHRIVPHQRVWQNSSLHTSCRAVLFVPLLRHVSERLTQRLGVLRIENKIPAGLPAFSQVRSNEQQLASALEPAWSLAAIRPYARARAMATPGDPVDEFSWNQYYEDHAEGAAWYRKLRERDHDWGALEAALSDFVETLVRVESLLAWTAPRGPRSDGPPVAALFELDPAVLQTVVAKVSKNGLVAAIAGAGAAIAELGDDLQRVPDVVAGTGQRMLDAAIVFLADLARLLPGETVARRTLSVLTGAPEAEPHCQSGDSASRGADACRLARALAIANGHADSFGPLDEQRAYFIADHIVRALGGNVLRQARSLGINLSPGGLTAVPAHPDAVHSLSEIQYLLREKSRRRFYEKRKEPVESAIQLVARIARRLEGGGLRCSVGNEHWHITCEKDALARGSLAAREKRGRGGVTA